MRVAENEESEFIRYVDSADPALMAVQELARATFGFFWREVFWERQRIVPGLDLAAAKIAFHGSDGGQHGSPQIEHMWVGDVNFDGQLISGVLLNAPAHLRGYQQGDAIAVPLEALSDWLYVQLGEAFGGFSVQHVRSAMSERERTEYDQGWGIAFGDPAKVQIVPGVFAESITSIGEHPMSANFASKFADQIKAGPHGALPDDLKGWSHLHHYALAGSFDVAAAFLSAGADPNLPGRDGMTPIMLARSLGWERLAALMSV